MCQILSLIFACSSNNTYKLVVIVYNYTKNSKNNMENKILNKKRNWSGFGSRRRIVCGKIIAWGRKPIKHEKRLKFISKKIPELGKIFKVYDKHTKKHSQFLQ